MTEGPLDRSLTALSEYYVGDLSLGAVLEKICRAATEAVDAAEFAGLSMTVDARVGTYVCTAPEVQEIEQPQYATGEGPCVDAFRTGRPVLIDATCEPGPYPVFRQHACAHGMSSVMSIPLTAGDQTVGALNLYATSAHAFTEHDREVVTTFATRAAFVLRNHRAYADARSLSENLQQAMESRAEIEQAKGIILGATGCTADEAFEQLKRQSQTENVRLRDIAREIVRNARRTSS